MSSASITWVATGRPDASASLIIGLQAVQSLKLPRESRPQWFAVDPDEEFELAFTCVGTKWKNEVQTLNLQENVIAQQSIYIYIKHMNHIWITILFFTFPNPFEYKSSQRYFMIQFPELASALFVKAATASEHWRAISCETLSASWPNSTYVVDCLCLLWQRQPPPPPPKKKTAYLISKKNIKGYKGYYLQSISKRWLGKSELA